MTLVTIDLGDVAGGHDPDDHVIIRAENFRESPGGGITSTAEVKIPLVDGVGQAEVEPGPVVVSFRCRAVADTREKRGVVPGSGTVGIEVVLENAFEYLPPVVNRALETINGAVDAAVADIVWHQDTPDPSWNIEDFPKGIWKIDDAAQRDRLGLPESYGVLTMHVYSPDRQSVQNAKTAYWLSLSHTGPTQLLVRSTNNVGVWETEWQPPFRYEPPTKQAAVPLTFPRGSSYSDDRPTLTMRIPFKLGAAVKRARLRLRNYDYRSDHGFPGSYRIVGAGIGKHQINDDGSMTGLVPEGESITRLMSSTPMTGPDEARGDWVDVDLEPNTDYLLSYSFTADDGMVYSRQTAQCFTSRLSNGWNSIGSTTATPSKMAVLSAILDVEVLEGTPIFGYLGDSQTAAISAERPGYDSWAMVHSRLAGAIPTIHGHAGAGLSEWQDPDKPAFGITDGMARFDRFHISMGSNDIGNGRPYTGVQQYLTTVMQNWRGQSDTFVLHNYLPRTGDNPTDNVRNALNDWVLNNLPGNALYAVDVWGATVDPATGLMAERWRGSPTDVHMNSAGNARIGLATLGGGSAGHPGSPQALHAMANDHESRLMTMESRASITWSYEGTGTPVISSYPGIKVGDYIVRKSDGQEWRVDA